MRARDCSRKRRIARIARAVAVSLPCTSGSFFFVLPHGNLSEWRCCCSITATVIFLNHDKWWRSWSISSKWNLYNELIILFIQHVPSHPSNNLFCNTPGGGGGGFSCIFVQRMYVLYTGYFCIHSPSVVCVRDSLACLPLSSLSVFTEHSGTENK